MTPMYTPIWIVHSLRYRHWNKKAGVLFIAARLPVHKNLLTKVKYFSWQVLNFEIIYSVFEHII